MIKKTRIAVGLAVFLAFLPGCQVLQPSVDGHAGDRSMGEALFGFRRGSDERRIARLIEYYAELASKDNAALEREVTQLRQGLEDNVCTDIRLQLGMAELARGGNTSPAVLAPCLGAENRPPTLINQFARLIEARLEQQRTHANALAVLHRRLEEQSKENRELRRQLDGLRAIERSLQRRDRSPRE